MNSHIFTFKSRFFSLFLAAGLMLGMAGCDLARNNSAIDRDANMDVQDFRDALQPRQVESDEGSVSYEEGIPDFKTYISEPAEGAQPVPLVSVSVNQNVPLRDVLFELARQTGMDLELDPNIRGSIILTARNKPFDVVIKRIAEMAGLRYTIEDGIFRVENDYPYLKTYRLDFINILRDSQTSVRTTVGIGGSGSDGAESQTDTGSVFSLDTTSTGDFWAEIEENLTHIMAEDVSAALLKTRQDPQLSVSAPAPVRPLASGDDDSQQGDGALAGGEQSRSAPPPTLSIQSLPTSGVGGGSMGGFGSEGAGSGSVPSTFSLNQQSGLVTVFAPDALHRKVQEFLKEVKKHVTSQVLIEAKVLEVRLTDEYSTGINWSAIISGPESTTGITSFLSPSLSRPVLDPAAANNFNFTASIDDVDIFVDALSRFGTVRALASPRITVLNNQPAVLNVTESRVYFEIEIETEEEGEGEEFEETSVEITSETFSVPEGVLINVHPAIDLESMSTILALKPTVTRVVNFVENPASAAAVAIAQADTDVELGDLQTSVPELSVQEFDSVIKLNSGEVAVLGGLLEDRVESTVEGIPIASELPMIGGLFRSKGDSILKSELVVLIKTTILETPSSSIHETDRQIYKKFAGDRRPFKL